MRIPLRKSAGIKVGAVIVAAGESQRMGGEDKVFALLGGESVLTRVVAVFETCEVVERIVVVVRNEVLARTRRMAAEQGWTKVGDVCAGGQRRQDSVRAGLEQLGACQWVIIHDGARPLVTVDLIERGLEAAEDTGAAVAAMPVTDTIKVVGMDRVVRHTPERSSLWAVQTPQVFRHDVISDAYRHEADDATDDSTLVEKSGHRVRLYQGSYDNMKIATPDDLFLAEALWQRRHARCA